jgi:DNA-binding MurR/RpiR family transcriptional regulator
MDLRFERMNFVADTPPVLKRLADIYPSLSTSQQQIANVIIKDPETAAFYNVAELARAAQVSDATVTRFARAIGYTGFPELCSQLQAVVRMRLTTKERLEKSQSSSQKDYNDVLFQSVEEDVQNLQMFLDGLDVEGLESCANQLLSCRKIGIVCSRSTLSLGLFFQFYLNFLQKDTLLITGEPRTLDYLTRLDANRDIVIGIGFSRYSRSTVTSLEYLHKKKMTTYAITDYPSSPLAKYVEKAFYCPTGIASYMDSLVAPLALLQALIRRMSQGKYSSTIEELTELEKIWHTFGVYTNSDLTE